MEPDKLIELASKATKGEWAEGGDGCVYANDEKTVAVIPRWVPENGAYIAACSPETITALCTELKAAREVVEALTEDKFIERTEFYCTCKLCDRSERNPSSERCNSAKVHEEAISEIQHEEDCPVLALTKYKETVDG